MATHDECIEIAVDRESISGTLITPGTLVPGVLFVHGWGGSQSQYVARAREIAALGCICLTFDLRGHERTRGMYETVSRAENLQDLLAAYDTLAARRHVDPNAIALVGSSYGGYLGAILTSMRPVKWMALRVPALYVDADWTSPKLQLHKDHDLKGYRKAFIPAAENRALRAVHAFEGDVLLVESENDQVIPQTVLTSYREACKQARSLTYRCLAGADHGLTSDADQRAYTSLLVGWMGEMVAGARASTAAPAAREAAAAEAAVVVPEAPPEAA